MPVRVAEGNRSADDFGHGLDIGFQIGATGIEPVSSGLKGRRPNH